MGRARSGVTGRLGVLRAGGESFVDDGVASAARVYVVVPGRPERRPALMIVAHGTDLNENSAAAAKRETERIRALGKYSAVLNVYMEEPPLVSDWKKLTARQMWWWFRFLFRTACIATKTFQSCLESRMKDRQLLRAGRRAKFSGATHTRSIIDRYSTRHPSAPIRASPMS